MPYISLQARRERPEGQTRDASQHRAPLGLRGRIEEQVEHPARALRHLEDPAVLDVGQPRAQRRHRRRDHRARHEAELGGQHLLLVEALAPRIVELAHRELLEQQRRVDQAGVHVEQQDSGSSAS